jgi:hypothetical protein
MDGPVVRDPEPGFYLAHLIAALEDMRERRVSAASAPQPATGPAAAVQGTAIGSASDGAGVAISDAVSWAGCWA